jgi:hypothetical protein
LGGATTPAFRPSSSASDSRALDGAFAWGLGLEARLTPWAALYGEWTFNSEHTHAADRGQPAQPVGLSSSAALTFDQSDLEYVMQAHVLAMGARFGYYHAPIMPWISLGLTEEAWDAFYLAGDSVQGQAQGQAFFVEAGVGLDIYLKLFGAGVCKLTPTLGFLTPVVNASMPNVGGTGLAWPDSAGTPVRAPLRAGLQLGIGF